VARCFPQATFNSIPARGSFAGPIRAKRDRAELIGGLCTRGFDIFEQNVAVEAEGGPELAGAVNPGPAAAARRRRGAISYLDRPLHSSTTTRRCSTAASISLRPPRRSGGGGRRARTTGSITEWYFMH